MCLAWQTASHCPPMVRHFSNELLLPGNSFVSLTFPNDFLVGQYEIWARKQTEGFQGRPSWQEGGHYWQRAPARITWTRRTTVGRKTLSLRRTATRMPRNTLMFKRFKSRYAIIYFGEPVKYSGINITPDGKDNEHCRSLPTVVRPCWNPKQRLHQIWALVQSSPF